MISVDLRPGEGNGGVAVVLRGDFEVAAVQFAGCPGCLRMGSVSCGGGCAAARGWVFARGLLPGCVPGVSAVMGAGRD